MSIKNKPAFPVTEREPDGFGGSTPYVYSCGMTTRLWLAGQALTGALNDPDNIGQYKIYAKEALMFADALIEEYDRKVEEERENKKGK